MEYALLIQLIAQVGLPLALKLYDDFQKKGPVPPEEIEALRKLAAQTPQTQMRDALTRAGIDLNSEHAKSLLALVEKPAGNPTTPQ